MITQKYLKIINPKIANRIWGNLENFSKFGSQIRLHISRSRTHVKNLREVFLNESIVNKNVSWFLKIINEFIKIRAQNL